MFQCNSYFTYLRLKKNPNQLDKSRRRKGHLFYSLVSRKIFLKGFSPLTVSQHDVVGDRCSSSAFRLHIGPVLCGQIKAYHQVTLWNIHSFLHNTGGNQQVGFMSSKFAEDLKKWDGVVGGGGAQRTELILFWLHLCQK